MNPQMKQSRGLHLFLAGIGGMCGAGYEYALYVLEQNDAEALAGDWRRVGLDWKNALAQAQDKVDEEQSKQATLNFPAAGLDE